MKVIGVDPGARQTGMVAIDTAAGGWAAPVLLGRTTVERDKAEPLLEVSASYLRTVVAALAVLVREHGAEVIAVEGLTRPPQHLNGTRARGGRGGAAADPTALMATGIVLGAVLGRTWGAPDPLPVVLVPPGRNGSQVAAAYPAPIAQRPGVRGQDTRRHERSAYDVARQAPQMLRLLAVRSVLR